MLNDVKYKSSLTLTLETPKSKSISAHSIAECFDDDTHVHSNLCEVNRSKDDMQRFIVINSNHLSNMNRIHSRNESFSESSAAAAMTTASSCSNETIIPIKYLIHDERTDCNQIDIGKITEISPKYCCTLEVKFVW